MKLKNWYTAKELSDICKISTRTLERRRNKLLNEYPYLDWFRMKSKPYKYSFKMMSEFTSPQVFELIDRTKSMSNTIKCMQSYGTLEYDLTILDWDYFVTITYDRPKPKMECRTLMHELYQQLKSQSSEEARMFYATESFVLSLGNHNHMVIKSDLKLSQIKDLIKEQEQVGVIDVQEYDSELAGVFYICKEIKHKNQELYWDILGSNLKADGDRIKKVKNASNI